MRLANAALVLLAVAVVDYGMIRVLRPEMYPGEGVLEGLAADLDRVLLQRDLGEACMFPGCPPLNRLFRQGFAADLWLLAGALAIGIAGGLAGGVWCATRHRTLAARALEWAAMVA